MNPFMMNWGRQPMTGIHNPFEAGVPFGALSYVPNPHPNNDAQNPTVGSYSYIPQPPRQQLAQMMAEPYYGRGGRGQGGYTTSGPQSGRFGYGGGMGGWGRNSSGGRTSSYSGRGLY